jgi:hypothetical protein
MENFPSPDDALSDLRKKGYEADLNFETDPYGLYSGDLDMRLNPEAYHVDKTIRIDDPSHPNESEIVYAISTDAGIKGTIVDIHEAVYGQNSLDTVSRLETLAGIIRQSAAQVDQHLRQMGESMIRISGSMPENGSGDLFNSSPVIEFQDWAEVQDASNLWDGWYMKVIKPLKKRDFHFIFHLGNVAKKLVYDVDEVLDIIGDYSSHGKVTLMLDNHEASSLWDKLDGPDPNVAIAGPASPQAMGKYRFIFNTMSIDSLVVIHGCSAVQLSRGGEIILPGRPPADDSEAKIARAKFSAGYEIGLLLQLEAWDCMALGLAVVGVGAGTFPDLNSSRLLAYIQDWRSIL